MLLPPLIVLVKRELVPVNMGFFRMPETFSNGFILLTFKFMAELEFLDPVGEYVKVLSFALLYPIDLFPYWRWGPACNLFPDPEELLTNLLV
jgi:hypothetical protein